MKTRAAIESLLRRGSRSLRRGCVAIAALVGVVLALGLPGCGAPARRPGPRAAVSTPLPFTVVPDAGLDFVLHCARGEQTNLLDTIGHGAAILDFDRDGRYDLILTGHDQLAAYRNLGEFRFQRVDVGLRTKGNWGGVAVGDIDNDGWPDLYVTGYGCAALYRNERGQFREITESAGLAPPRWRYPAWGTSAGFADLDDDGKVDLVVCYYLEFGPDLPQRCPSHVEGVFVVCAPRIYHEQRPRVYRNLGNGRFEDVTVAWGVRGHGGALGIAFQDVNDDGRTDFAIANDARPGDLFLNLGRRFVEIGTRAGVAYDMHGRVYAGMGLDWGDLNGDHRPDLANTAFYAEVNPLYLSVGPLQYEEASTEWGTAAITQWDVSFGARLFDYDLDGHLDLMLANGHALENADRVRTEDRYAQPIRLFRNVGGRFALVAPEAWPVLVGRALATGDLDNDGDLDVLISNIEGQPIVLRNTGPRGHWLGISLEGRRSNRMALGARVEVIADGVRRRFEVHTASSYMSAHDPRLIVGLGAATEVERIVVRWPASGITEIASPGVDRWIEIRE